MRCSKCGNDNPVGKRFCGNCGSPLEPQPLVMTPELQQAIKILQLSLPELKAIVQKEMDAKPNARTKK